jgi:hypothetical protein
MRIQPIFEDWLLVVLPRSPCPRCCFPFNEPGAVARASVHLGTIASLVTSDDLTPDQAERLKDVVGRQLRFLNRLVARMQQRQFPTDDPLWIGAIAARNAAQDLFVAAHYAGCKSGVGRSAKDNPHRS